MKRISLVLLWYAAAGASLAASWETSVVRTANGGLVRVGMPAQQALHELGPAAQRSRGGKPKHKGEVWTWRGDDGLYHISISQGRVTKIVVTPNRD
jgi:hypothetical protein